MAKMELANIAKMELSNEYLKVELGNMVLAIKNANGNAWIIAESMAKIVNESLWEDDFNELQDLCNMLGVTKGYGSQCVKAVEIANKLALDRGLWTVGKAYAFKDIENIMDFDLWLSNNYDLRWDELFGYSDKAVIGYVKEYKHKDDVVEVESEEVENEETTGEEVDEEVEMVIFEVDGKTYCMPKSVLDEYVVE